MPNALPAETSVEAMLEATPLCSMAAEMPNAAAMVTMTSHFTADRAASSVKHPVASMTPDAKSAATKRSSAPAARRRSSPPQCRRME